MADPADHAGHDPMQIAAALDRSATLAVALTACAPCSALHEELRLVVAAAPGAWLPARPRDYRLRATDAARLRPRSTLARLLGALGDARGFVRGPIAMSLLSLGMVGLLLTALPSAVPLGAGPGGGVSGAEAVDTMAPLQAEVVPMGSARADGSGPGDPARPLREAPAVGAAAPIVPVVRPLLILSLAFLAAGLVLLGLGVAGRAGKVR